MGQTVTLYAYHNWANQRLLHHLKELPEPVWKQEVQSIFPTIEAVIRHVYQVDHVWLYTMEGRTFEEVVEAVSGMNEETKDWTLDEWISRHTALSSQILSFLEQQRDLHAISSYRHPHFGELRVSFAEIVQHIVNHGTYHRGNLTVMLRQLGCSGVSTDYIFYLYERNQTHTA